jgi:hypothetical protein
VSEQDNVVSIHSAHARAARSNTDAQQRGVMVQQRPVIAATQQSSSKRNKSTQQMMIQCKCVQKTQPTDTHVVDGG